MTTNTPTELPKDFPSPELLAFVAILLARGCEVTIYPRGKDPLYLYAATVVARFRVRDNAGRAYETSRAELWSAIEAHRDPLGYASDVARQLRDVAATDLVEGETQ